MHLINRGEDYEVQSKDCKFCARWLTVIGWRARRMSRTHLRARNGPGDNCTSLESPPSILLEKSNVTRTAFAMPLTNPSYPRGPYRFVDREYLIITYRTDPDALRAVVP